MTGPLTLGVIGCGSVARNAYLPLVGSLRARGDISTVVACDLDADRVRALADTFPIDRTSTDPADVLGDPRVDVVAILTSMAEHGRLAIEAIKAGKHVLVEKPMATTLAEGEELLRVAGESDRFLLCAPHVLLSPDYQEMHRLMTRGGIGRPILARARYGWDGPDWSAWFYAPGGGPLFDLGVYNVTTLTGLLGPVRRVTSMARVSRPERRVEGRMIEVQTDDTFQITLEHEQGTLSTVSTAFGMQKYRGPAVEIYGLDGTVQMMGDDWAPAGLEYWSNEVGTWQVIDSAGRYWPWTDGLSHLVRSIRSGTPPYTRPEHAFHVLEVMTAAMTAARTGQTQDVFSRFEPPAPVPAGDRRQSHRIHDRIHEEAQ